MDGVDMKLFTIGFTGKNAEKFFSLLESSEANKLIDIRINRTSQLAGFTKEQDLEFFLPKIVGMQYQVWDWQVRKSHGLFRLRYRALLLKGASSKPLEGP